MKRAISAKKNKLMYDSILKPACLQKGKHYESALKIKTANRETSLSHWRVYEKIILNDQSEGLKQWIQQKKPQVIEKISKSQQTNKITLFNQLWSQVIFKIENLVLQNKKQIPFCVGDLLRGKALFKKKSDISKTVKLIEYKFSQLDSSRYSILQTENRLEKPTKDFKIIFMIEDTIAQLQLAMEMNKEQNQFNHKLYELKRAKGSTHLMNLWLINERLSDIFFNNQLELCFFMIEQKDKAYIAGKQNLQSFKQQILSKNVTTFSNQYEWKIQYSTFYNEDRKSMLSSIEKNLTEIQNLLQEGYVCNGKFARNDIRKANDLTFMK